MGELNQFIDKFYAQRHHAHARQTIKNRLPINARKTPPSIRLRVSVKTPENSTSSGQSVFNSLASVCVVALSIKFVDKLV
jgi:hypothetical protein